LLIERHQILVSKSFPSENVTRAKTDYSNKDRRNGDLEATL
jgi:hypothetical protein